MDKDKSNITETKEAIKKLECLEVPIVEAEELVFMVSPKESSDIELRDVANTSRAISGIIQRLTKLNISVEDSEYNIKNLNDILSELTNSDYNTTQ